MTKVPETVVFHCAKSQKAKTLDGGTVNVTPAYAAYTASKARMKSGGEWAKNPAGMVEVPNKFTKIQLHELEYRGEGGRAYKVTVDDKFYVDLREEPLLDMMLHVGIQKGATIFGDFCFGVSSEFRLMRRASKEYNDLVAVDIVATERKQMAKTNKFQYGKLYMNDAGTKRIYLGVVSLPETELDPTYKNQTNYGRRFGFRVNESAKPVQRELWLNENVVDDNGAICYIYAGLIYYTKTSRLIDLDTVRVTTPLSSFVSQLQAKWKFNPSEEKNVLFHSLNVRCFKIDKILSEIDE